jgi:hypothetical protein
MVLISGGWRRHPRWREWTENIFYPTGQKSIDTSKNRAIFELPQRAALWGLASRLRQINEPAGGSRAMRQESATHLPIPPLRLLGLPSLRDLSEVLLPAAPLGGPNACAFSPSWLRCSFCSESSRSRETSRSKTRHTLCHAWPQKLPIQTPGEGGAKSVK